MHKTAVFFSALILGAALLTGCGKKTEPPQESETQTKQETVSATEQAKANETGAVTNTPQAALVAVSYTHLTCISFPSVIIQGCQRRNMKIIIM